MTDPVRLKWLLDERDERAGEQAATLPLLSVLITRGVQRRDASDTTKRAAAEDLSNYKIGRAGDLVINRMRAFQGALGIAPEDGVVSPDYSVLRVSPLVERRWLNYYLTSTSTVSEMSSLVRGIGGTEAGNVRTPRLNVSDLHSMRIRLEPLDQQRAIADYLDRETARIDTLIEEQQRLVELLQERRMTLRTEGALQGIRACDIVDSPLPWARTLPAGWPVVPLTSVARLESGHTPSRSREDWWQDCYIPWISLNDVGAMRTNKYIDTTTNQLSDQGIANSSARLLPAHTVVLSRDATVGRTAIMKVPMATSQHFAAWVCGPRLDPEYLWTLFTDAMQPYFASFQNGSTIRTIGMGDLAAFRIPLPPMDEQRRIVAHLDEQTAKIDTVIAETERFIELSQERRSALVTAAVTGQIDVRGEVA